ncbi:MAG: DUF455 family protein, partial [Pseudomonadota bacterium]
MNFEAADSNPLLAKSVWDKLRVIEQSCHSALVGQRLFEVPEIPGRDIEVCAASQLPPKPGLSSEEGHARLLHDLASIELQAMELGFRTLVELSSDAPSCFREQLGEIILDEARHLRLCLEQIQRLGFEWGDWPSHLGLWSCVCADDSLLERLVIVHRYLEGSGLDASDKIHRRLSGTLIPGTGEVVKLIAEEEVGHVLFGSKWFREFCQLDPSIFDSELEFKRIVGEVFPRLPR